MSAPRTPCVTSACNKIFGRLRKPESPSQAVQKSLLQNGKSCVIMTSVSDCGRIHIGMSPSGKAPDFDSGIRRFKSCHPSQFDPLAQLAEQLPFKQWVRSSNLRRVTKKDRYLSVSVLFARRRFEQLSSQYAGGILLPPVQKLVAAFISPQGKCKRISAGHRTTSAHSGICFFAHRRFEYLSSQYTGGILLPPVQKLMRPVAAIFVLEF